ncbi:MAG: BRO family protein [Clostridia bacterium]
MDENKMHLINKIFNSETIRTIWDKEDEKYYISIVDIVSIISESRDGRKYWNKLKQRLKEEGNETVTNCHQLKLKAQDGKYRMTDVCDIEGMFRIIESIPSKNAEPIKQWLAHLGKERIDEAFDPGIALQRAIDLYRIKGYDEDWIAKRIKSIQERKKLTDVWKENGIESNIEYAILTNEIYKEWSGMTAKEYKQYKGLRKENLRDNMDNIELILTDLSEEATKRLAQKQKPNGLKENMKVAKMGGHTAKVAREDIEKNLGESVVTRMNKLNYKYIEDGKNENKKLSDKNENPVD